MNWKLFGECEVPMCHKYGFFIMTRHIKIPGIGWTTSKTRQCGSCARKIRRMVKGLAKNTAQ